MERSIIKVFNFMALSGRCAAVSKKKPPEEGRSGKITIDNYSLLEYNLIKEEEQKQRGEVP